MHITGGCHCGNITYEAEIDPEMVSICHCSDCQKLSGSAFRVVAFAKAEDFHLHGTPTIYIKTAESGNQRAQAFCPQCGSALYASAPDNSPNYGIRLGTCDQRAELVPKRQVWHQSALPWLSSKLDMGKILERQQ